MRVKRLVAARPERTLPGHAGAAVAELAGPHEIREHSQANRPEPNEADHHQSQPQWPANVSQNLVHIRLPLMTFTHEQPCFTSTTRGVRHRARAALRWCRRFCVGVMLANLALPPLRPPCRPISRTTNGFARA